MTHPVVVVPSPVRAQAALALLAVLLATRPTAAAQHGVQLVPQGDTFAFSPQHLTIQEGDTVIWGNVTGVAHNVVADDGSFRCAAGCDGGGGSGNLSASPWTFTLVFGPGAPTPGPWSGDPGGGGGPGPGYLTAPGVGPRATRTFRYHCDAHGAHGGAGMSGTIVVESGGDDGGGGGGSASAGVLRFTSANLEEDENGGNAVARVERVNGDDGAVGVSWATSNATAVAGSDYGAANGSLSWQDGEIGEKTFAVAVIDDGADENDETLKLTLSAPTGGATIGNPSQATLRIVDNDDQTAGRLQLASAAYSAGEGQPNVVVGVERKGGTQGAIAVDYDTSAVSAAAGSDYAETGGTLDWAAGDGATKTFAVPLVDDAEGELTEMVRVSLSAPVGGATLGTPAQAMLAITDNDGGPDCEDTGTTLCLLDRFFVSAHWKRPTGVEGEGRASKLSDGAGAFEFFEVGNLELFVKMTSNGCSLAAGNPLRNYWVFLAGLTNVEVTVTIVDTVAGTQKIYTNPLGISFKAVQATSAELGAFPTCDS
jgi:plastocyanin